LSAFLILWYNSFVDILKKFRAEKVSAEDSLSKEQKLAVFGLAVFGFFILILWAASMKNNIYKPFADKPSSSLESTCPNGNCSAAEAEKTKNQDTDGDGLTDWDELNVYFTSPYLEDSDSDGTNDGVEVQNNQDPNCPKGQDCGSVAADASPVSATDGLSEIFLNQEQVNSNQEELSKLFSGQADATTIRQLLKEAGASDDILSKISDQELVDYYSSVLQGEVAEQ
jgi:hypothetical protein